MMAYAKAILADVLIALLERLTQLMSIGVGRGASEVARLR
jgi:hypothetical protein